MKRAAEFRVCPPQCTKRVILVHWEPSRYTVHGRGGGHTLNAPARFMAYPKLGTVMWGKTSEKKEGV